MIWSKPLEYRYSKLIAICAICTLLLTACKKAENAPAKPEEGHKPEHQVHLPTMHVTSTRVQSALNFPGKVNALPDHSALITPNIAGKIIRVFVVPGQHVNKGQVIALLDDRQLVAQLEQAKAPQRAAFNQVEQTRIALDLAEKNLVRSEALFAKDIAAEKDVVTARSQVELSKAQVEAAQAKVGEAKLAPAPVTTQLAFTRVLSPLTGVVAQRFLNVGDLTDPGKPIAHIINLDSVIIAANMPADSPANPRVGHNATITTVAEAGVKYTARITSVSPVVDAINNTVLIELLARNDHGRLKEGQQVIVSVAAPATNAALVPQSALVPDNEDPSKHLVYVVRDGKLKQTKVVVGDRQGENIAVLKGLSPGDQVVTSGAYGVPDGAIFGQGEQPK